MGPGANWTTVSHLNYFYKDTMLAKQSALKAAFRPGLAAISKLLGSGKEGMYNIGKRIK